MSDRLKRILLILGFILVTVGIGYAIYFLFFRPLIPVTPTVPVPPKVTGQLPTAGTGVPTVPGAPTGPTGLPTAPTVPTAPLALPAPAPAERATALNLASNQQLSISPTGGVRSYHPDDGKFYRVDNNGNAVPMSDQTFLGVENVSWGNTTDKAILTFPDSSKILYDFNTKRQVTLPKYWEDFSFSPTDDHIAAKSIGNNNTNRFIVVANPDGSNAVPVESMGDNQDKVHISWSPNDQIVAYAFTADPVGFDQQAIVMIGQHQENFKNLIVEGRDFTPSWSPSGDTLLYSVYNSNNDYMPKLWISGAVGDSMNANRHSIELNTWADKCAWQNETSVVCAVPTSLPIGAGLQRSIADDIPDTIYKIDLTTGQKVNLGTPAGAPTVTTPKISADGRTLYYTDKTTGRLSKFAL